MKKGLEKSLSVLELVRELNYRKKAIVSFVETFIVVGFAIVADIAEITAPVIGLLLVGIPISLAIILWSLLRGIHGRFVVKRVIVKLLIFILDAATVGLLPLRTIGLIITIWINNHFDRKDIKRILKVLGGHL